MGQPVHQQKGLPLWILLSAMRCYDLLMNSTTFREITYFHCPKSEHHNAGPIEFRHNHQLQFIIAKTLGAINLRYLALVVESAQITPGMRNLQRRVPTTTLYNWLYKGHRPFINHP
jgi:hypothetical protein